MRKKLLPIIVPISLIAIIGCFIYFKGMGNTPERNPSSINRHSNKEEQNSFSFTVESTKCKVSKVGPADPYKLHLIAQGQFCLLDVIIKNTGTARKELSSRIYLTDSNGKKYAPDLYGTSLVNDPWGDIEPDTELRFTIVFDIDKGVQAVSAEFQNTSSKTTIKLNQ